MELLKNSFNSVIGGYNAVNDLPSSADTIERLVERLKTSTLLEDRRDSCRALKAMSRKYRVEVGALSLEHLISVLEMYHGKDEEIVGYALDSLCNICSPEEFEEEVEIAIGAGHGEQFTEIFLKQKNNVQLVINCLNEIDFRVRRPALRLLTCLLTNKTRDTQQLILVSEMGISFLMDVLNDNREILRNDTLLLLILLTKGNVDLQKIVVFENAFDKLIEIINIEGCSDGGIVVEDCLRLMLNLLRNNSSNQTFFREGNFILRTCPFFDLNLADAEIEIGWSAQKVSNMLYMLLVVRTLVSTTNSSRLTVCCQNIINSCQLLSKLCLILMASGIPADILTETINTLAEVIRGNYKNQIYLDEVIAPSHPPRPVLLLLLMSMVNNKQPFGLRCAVLYCFQCYLHKNVTAQEAVLKTLLPSTVDDSVNDDVGNISTGQLICGGLFAVDTLSNWFAAVALSHTIAIAKDNHLKLELLRVQLSTITANEAGPISLMSQCAIILQTTNHLQTRIGLLMLISTWVADCVDATIQWVSEPKSITFLTSQICSNEHDDIEKLVHGLSAFLLGLCTLNLQGTAEFDRLMQLIEKRIGVEAYLDKLSEVGKHEAYSRGLKHTQLNAVDTAALLLDIKFCEEFKHNEFAIIQLLSSTENEVLQTNKDETGSITQYKEIIRSQDAHIQEITAANLFLQQELNSTQQINEELKANIESARDENSLLRATQSSIESKSVASVTTEKTCDTVGECSNCIELNNRLSSVEKIHEQVINDLESRLQIRSNDSCCSGCADLKEQLSNLQNEQDDLLIMLSDQDSKLILYRKKLEELAVVNDIDPDEDVSS